MGNTMRKLQLIFIQIYVLIMHSCKYMIFKVGLQGGGDRLVTKFLEHEDHQLNLNILL